MPRMILVKEFRPPGTLSSGIGLTEGNFPAKKMMIGELCLEESVLVFRCQGCAGVRGFEPTVLSMNAQVVEVWCVKCQIPMKQGAVTVSA